MENPGWLRKVKRVEVLGDGEGVRIVKLRVFISEGLDGQANKQAWCLVTLDKSIEPRGIGTLESG